MTTSTEALNLIESRTAGLTGNALKQELTKILSEVSIGAKSGYTMGNITVLYAAVGTPVAATMVNDPSVRIIDKTEAAALLTDRLFQTKIAESFGLTFNDLKGLPDDHPLNQFLYDGKTGLWAQTSKRFVEATTGEVRIITDRPRLESHRVRTAHLFVV